MSDVLGVFFVSTMICTTQSFQVKGFMYSGPDQKPLTWEDKIPHDCQLISLKESQNVEDP